MLAWFATLLRNKDLSERKDLSKAVAGRYLLASLALFVAIVYLRFAYDSVLVPPTLPGSLDGLPANLLLNVLMPIPSWFLTCRLWKKVRRAEINI